MNLLIISIVLILLAELLPINSTLSRLVEFGAGILFIYWLLKMVNVL